MTLKLGVPSKGRLMEKTFEWFGDRGDFIGVYATGWAEFDDVAPFTSSTLTIEGWALTRNLASHEGVSLLSKRNAYNDGDVYNLFIWTGQLVNGRVNGNNTNIGLSTTAIHDNTCTKCSR